MTELQNSLFETMIQFSNYAISNTKADTTIACTVLEVLDEKSYKVAYQENSFTAYTDDEDKIYEKGNSVYVLIPGGDFSQVKKISGLATPGTVKKNNTDTVVETEYQDLDGFDLNKSTVELCTYKGKDSKTISIVENIEDYKKILETNLENPKTNSFRFTYNITTKDIPEAQTRLGNYGITLTIPVKNKITGEIDKIECTIDSRDMEGNPYSFDKTKQEKLFKIDGAIYESCDNEPTIEVYCKNYIENSEKQHENDIIFSDFTLNPCYEITAEDRVGYTLYLTATQGNTFIDKDAYNKTKTITPTLIVDGKKVNTYNLKTYWFQQDLSILETSKEYLDYGGIGWKCVNEPIKDDDGNIIDFNSQKAELTVGISTDQSSDVYMKSENAVFKCVIIYNKTPITSEFITLTHTNNFAFTLEKTKNGSYNKGIEGAEITARVKTNGKEIKFLWQLTDNHNIAFENLSNIIEFNTIEYIDDYAQATILVDTKYLNSYGTLYCSANYIDGNDVSNIGVKNVVIPVVEDNNFLVTVENDNKTYSYDSNGISPFGTTYAGAASQILNTIKPMKITVRNIDGNPFTAYDYSTLNYCWYFPISNLFEINEDLFDKEDDGKTLKITPVQDIDYYTISRNREIPYKISTRFNEEAAFYSSLAFVMVEYQNNRAMEFLNFNFIKEEIQENNRNVYTAELVSGDENRENSIPYNKLANNRQYKKLKYYYFNDTIHYYNYKDNKLATLSPYNIFLNVYKNGELLDRISKIEEKDDNGNIIKTKTIINYNVSYEMYDASKTNPCFSIKSEENNSTFISLDFTKPNDFEKTCNIVQAKIEILSEEDSSINQLIFCYYPIELIYSDMNLNLIYEEGEHTSETLASIYTDLDAGFNEVVYSNGVRPDYNHAGFAYGLYNFIDNSFLNEKPKITLNIVGNSNIHVSNINGSFYPSNDYKNGNSNNLISLNCELDLSNLPDTSILIPKQQQIIADLKKEIEMLTDEDRFLNNYIPNKFKIITLINDAKDIDYTDNNNVKNFIDNNIIICFINGEEYQYKNALDYIYSYYVYYDKNKVTVNIESFNQMKDFINSIYTNTTLSDDYDLIEGILSLRATLSTSKKNEKNKELAKANSLLDQYMKIDCIKKDGLTEAKIIHYRPIVFYSSMVGNETIESDGNKIYVNDQQGENKTAADAQEIKNTYLLNTQVGYGSYNEENKFSGMLIGQRNTEMKSGVYNSETGLFAYHDGEQTVFIDAKTGKAEFGKETFRIVLDPEKPDTQGIYYSNKRFKVDKDGNLTASNITLVDKNGQQTSVFIENGAIKAEIIQSDSVGEAQLKDNAVTESKIKDEAVTNKKIVSLDASKITGNIPLTQISGTDNGKIVSNQIKTITKSQISDLDKLGTDASLLTEGTLNNDRLNNIPLTKISGYVDTTNADNITSGTLNNDRLDNIPLSKIDDTDDPIVTESFLTKEKLFSILGVGWQEVTVFDINGKEVTIRYLGEKQSNSSQGGK